MSVPVNHKFACLSFEHLASFTQNDPVTLGEGCSIHFRPPFELDDTWKEWIGSINAQKVHESNFFILATAPSDNPGILDHEHQELDKRVYALWYAILLHSTPDYQGVLSFQGSNEDGEVRIRSHSTPSLNYKTRHAQPVYVTPELLQSADRIAQAVRAMYASPTEYARLKRGLMAAWLAGSREHYGDARLHQFIRASEALIKPRIGRTKRDFVARAAFFIGDTASNRNLLTELYDLRSAAEHMNDFNLVLTPIDTENRERRAWLRSYQAELLAEACYLRVLSNQHLLELFRTEEGIDDFWRLPEDQRRARWGAVFDLEADANSRHQLDPEPRSAVTPFLRRTRTTHQEEQ